MTKLEIAICTWNRADSLAQTLSSINQATPPNGCEVSIIVVNNGSTDHTNEVLDSFDANTFPLTVILEPQQGLSICRNRAIDAATGDFLIWTDDDVMVSPTWLVNYASAFSKHKDASFWGGPILPLLPDDTPAWVSENMETLKGCFAGRELGDTPFKFNPSLLPYGANFAVRTSVQKKFLFDTTLGRKGKSLDGGEETDLLARLLASDHVGYWVPEASLDHFVDNVRLTETWMRNYFEAQGRALVKSGKPWTRHVWWLKLAAWYHNRRYNELKRNDAPSPAWLAHLIRSSLAAGQADAFRNA
jgi:glycosyltransferase involved in cell wall biosynthesis